MQRLFDIVTDSCADMPEAYYAEKGVERVKLGFTMQNVNYSDCLIYSHRVYAVI